MLKLDFWDYEWPAITSAPAFWAVVIAVFFILLTLVMLAIGRRELARLRGEKAALSERVRLAHDEHAKVSQQIETLTEQLAQLSEQIDRKDALANLAYASETATGTVHTLSFANNALGRILAPTPPIS